LDFYFDYLCPYDCKNGAKGECFIKYSVKIYIQGVSGGIVNILGGGSKDYSGYGDPAV